MRKKGPQPIRYFSLKPRYLAAFLVSAICLISASLRPSCVFANDKPRVRNIAVRKLTVGDGEQPKVTLAIDISGDRLGTSDTSVDVVLINLDTGKPNAATITKHDAAKILATVELPTGKEPVKYEFRVKVAGENAIPEAHLSDFTVTVKKEEAPKPKAGPLPITFESFKSEEYPNLHSLLITNKSEDPSNGFTSNPALMKVDLVPAGATNVTIHPGGNSYQMLVTYLAPEKFEPKGVIVTVFDPASTLANNQPKFFSTPFKEKPPKEDPNQPKISEVAVTSMQRRSGYGTLRISGSGFGDYERAPINGERELLCCVNRPSNPNISDEQGDRREDNLAPADTEVCRMASRSQCDAMADWRQRIEERVNVTLAPRNVDYRIERTQVMYIDDKVIDVYFEFSRWDQYSVPMRLQDVTVTFNKGAVRQAATSDTDAKYTAVLASPQTFIATSHIGAPSDKNIEYRYTILNQKDAGILFGKGVGENFFVIQLSVVNNGKKKMMVPLGSIQAEAAWLYGWPNNKKNPTYFYEEGPATLPPVPLGAVSGYFDAHQKSTGRWAKVFNVLDGVATLGAQMVPIIKELERPTLILTTGVVPGLKKAIGDLSSEQIARLTNMSWENIEEIPAGGSQTKFIYIPRAEQLFGDFKRYNDDGTNFLVRKKVIDIAGLEVSGFEVVESEKKQATENPSGTANGNGNGGPPQP
ncbi:MAG TPA: hypothetical protein VJT71_10885 [Pyrinomonadaceae bacterium]|nr:hypothetical protein [Pyrinomonadaceae bacterium]